MDLRDMNLQIVIEIVDGGFIVTSPILFKTDDNEHINYRRSVLNSPRKVVKAVSEALNEFKLTSEE